MATTDASQRLGQLPLFKDFSQEALRLIGGLAADRTFRVGETIFIQGAKPDYCYLVDSGTILETATDASGATTLQFRAGAGDLLDRWSAYNNEEHTVTATVVRPAVLWRFAIDDFQSLLNRYPQLRQRLERTGRVSRLRAIPLFGGFSDEQLFQVAELVDEVEYSSGETIFAQGDKPDFFYVIDEGRVVEDVGPRFVGSHDWPKYFTAGSFFGRRSLIDGTLRRATAKAETPVKLFRIRADAFHWLRQHYAHFADGLERFKMLERLKQAALFKGLGDADLRLLAGYVGLAFYAKDFVVFYQGETEPTYYLLYNGEAVKRFQDERGRERPIGALQAGDGVGQDNLFAQEAWAFSLVTRTPTSWLYLCRTDLDQFLLRRPDAKKVLAPPDRYAPDKQPKQFDWQDLDEQVMAYRRRHWFALLDRLASWPTLIWLGVPFLLFLLSFLGPIRGVHLERIFGPLALIFGAFYLLWRVVDWLNDYFVITTKRLVQRERVLFVLERRYEVPLSKVQNVNFYQNFLGNLFGFGRLHVITAATSGVQPLSFDYVAEPSQVKSLIFEEVQRFQAARGPEVRRSIREQLQVSTHPGIHPVIPKPVAQPSAIRPKNGGLLARAYEATLGSWFWVEKRTEDQVTWRKHRIRLLYKIWIPSLFILLGIPLWVLLIGIPLLGILGLAAMLVPLCFWWWWRFVDWGNDLYIVTSDRIIDTDRLPLGFRYKWMEAPFDRIQNVTSEVPNFFANLLNYGTVYIFTAGVEGRLDFPYVPGPREVQAEIFRRMAIYEEQKRREAQEQVGLADWFSAYQQTRP